MTEKDFIYAWLLASRVNPSVLWTEESMAKHIQKARELYQLIERKSK